jgi:predicted TIM-barrel fold metal-dependent hydrolase
VATTVASGGDVGGLSRPAERIGLQNADSIDAEVLYPDPLLWDAIQRSDDAEFKVACCRAYNDWIAEFCAYSPGRLIGLGKIPDAGAAAAEEELTRCVRSLNLSGVILDGWPSDTGTLGDERDNPFWSAAHDLDVPISLHYAIGGGRTLPSPEIGPGMNPPMANDALPLVQTGIFDRYPNLKIVLAHGDAGWVAHWLEFTDVMYRRMVATRTYTLEKPDADPSDYIRRHFWFTFHEDRAAVKSRNRVGMSHLLWASHLPFEDTSWPDDRGQAARMTEELPVEETRKLLVENTARLYRLPGYEAGFAAADLEAFPPLVHL